MIRDDVIGGFNAFLETQQKEKGKTTLTLVQFDTQNPYEVLHHMQPIQEIPKLTSATYVPRASTPLLDALGRGINDLEKSMADQIVMVVITDGQENASIEFNKAQIAEMIKERQEKDNWQFVFLSADLASFDDAGDYGFHKDSSMAYDKSSGSVMNSFVSLGDRINDFRKNRANDVSFNEKDRSKHQSEKKKK